MIGIREIQFAGIVLMLILVVLLTSIRIPKTPDTKPYRTSRGFMMLSISILLVHFILQRALDLRNDNSDAAILVNLVFFIPATGCFHLGYLHMQRLGRMNGWELVYWPIIYGISTIALTVGLIYDRGNFEGRDLKIIEQCVGLIFLLSMILFDCLSVREFFLTRKTLANYYDYPAEGNIKWTFRASIALFYSALPIPFVIFYGFNTVTFILTAIFFFFYSYAMIHFALFYFEQKTIATALKEKNEESTKEAPEMRRRACRFNDEELIRIADALKGWADKKSYTTAGLTIDDLSNDIAIPRTTISLYLNEVMEKTFRDWLTDLRIEEACRQLAAHPDYSNAYIAEACGFSSRQYFQNVFHARTGKTPLGWIKENVKK